MFGTPENPKFLAEDVAVWIDYDVSSINKMLNSVDENEKALGTFFREDGSTHKQWLLTEDGLYEVFMQSRKPIAKEFKKRVKQMLKEMRRYGFTVSSDKLEQFINDPVTIIQMAKQVKEYRRINAELSEANNLKG